MDDLYCVDLSYRLATFAGVSPTTQEKQWFFAVPVGANAEAFWAELLPRVFYDANVKLRRAAPNDESWLVLDSFRVTPVDLRYTLSWDGTMDQAHAQRFLPWMIAHSKTVWEWSSALVVDGQGRYDGLAANDFSELLGHIAHERGIVDDAGLTHFFGKMNAKPGAGAQMFAERAERLANIRSVRDTANHRRKPGTAPFVCGPPAPEAPTLPTASSALRTSSWLAVLELDDHATVGDLERALGIELPASALGEGRGKLIAPAVGTTEPPLSTSVVGLFALYWFDLQRDPPMTDLSRVRELRAMEFAVRLSEGHEALSEELQRRYGAGRDAQGFRVYGKWALGPPPVAGSPVVLCRYGDLPERLLPVVTPERRAALLRTFAERVEASATAKQVADAIAELSPDLGLEGTLMSDERIFLKVRPRLPALLLADLLRWHAPLAASSDRHGQRWSLKVLAQPRGQAELADPRLGRFSVKSSFEGRPTGSLLEGPRIALAGPLRLGAEDRIEGLELNDVGEPPEISEPADPTECRLRCFPREAGLRQRYEQELDGRGLVAQASYARQYRELEECLVRGENSVALEERLKRLQVATNGLDDDWLVVPTSGAEEWGAMAKLAPASLAGLVEAIDPAPRPASAPESPPGFRVLVLGDFAPLASRTSLEDRGCLHVAIESFQSRLAQQRLVFAVTAAGRQLQVPIETLFDFEDAGLTERFAAEGATPEQAAAAIELLRSQDVFQRAERTWRALWWLLRRMPEGAALELLDCAKSDLAETFRGAPAVARSGLSLVVNRRDHQGHAPNTLLLVAHDLDPSSDLDVLTKLGELAQRGGLAVVAGLDLRCLAAADGELTAYTDWRRTPEAAHLALCGPGLALQDATGRQSAAPGSFLAAAMVAAAFGRHAVGSPLLGRVEGARAQGVVDRELALRRGFFSFRDSPEGAVLQSDETCRAGESLAATMVVTRLTHHLLDLDRCGRSEGQTPSPEELMMRLNEQLAGRLGHVLTATLRELVSESSQRMNAKLSIKLASPLSLEGITLLREVSLRVG